MGIIHAQSEYYTILKSLTINSPPTLGNNRGTRFSATTIGLLKRPHLVRVIGDITGRLSNSLFNYKLIFLGRDMVSICLMVVQGQVLMFHLSELRL